MNRYLYSFLLLFSGKYSSNNSPDDNTNNVNGRISTTTDANKKLDEITPLLNQASISSTNSLEQDDETNVNVGNGSNRSGGAHKTNYRKRIKTKLSRKTA